MTNFNDSELKEHLIQAANLLFQCGVMSHSGHGNLSVRLPGTEQMLITARGTIADLTPKQLARCWGRHSHTLTSYHKLRSCPRAIAVRI